MNTSYLSFGSNIGDRKRNLDSACELLNRYGGEVTQRSSVYETEAWGYEDSQNYYNQVIAITTNLSPKDLLKTCMQVETSLGRVRSKKGYEARTIDIDILFYNNELIQLSELTIPHEHLHKRMFVLKPLVEIAPDFIHPGFNLSIAGLLGKCEDNSWIKVLQ